MFATLMYTDWNIFNMYDNEIMCPERDELIARYSLLDQECELLKHRLANTYITTSSTPSIYNPPTFRKQSSSVSSTAPSSPIAPHTLFPCSYSYSPSSPTSDTFLSLQSSHSDVHSDEDALADINCQIKATLTELLNCESVKGDGRVRAWVQERLMEKEHDLRRERRRKSSADREERVRVLEGCQHGKSLY